jgi:hypothetical protein
VNLINPLIQNLDPNKIIVVDFETFYDVGYTLSGDMSMSEYVRDSRFLVHGAAIKIGKEPAKWVDGADLPKLFTGFTWQDTLVLAHNTQFDGFILAEHYGIVPGAYLDTLAMARGTLGHATRHSLKVVSQVLNLGEKDLGALENTKGKKTLTRDELDRLAVYSVNDAELCFQAFWKMYPNITDEELELINKTVKMFCDPVLETDHKLLQELINAETNKKSTALVNTGLEREDLLSANKFASALCAAGMSAENLPIKTSPTTGKEIYAFSKTDEGFKKLLNHDDPKIRALAEARLVIKSTINETRAGRILANSNGRPLPVSLNYYGAHTGRWSGGNKINLQNLPKGSGLRRAIVAPSGHVLVVADSAQIEARITAWLAGELELVEAFRSGKDAYRIMASKIYNKAPEDITKEERFIGKTCVLGLGFGMSGTKLKATLASGALGPPAYISDAEAMKYVSIYRTSYPRIPQLWREMDGYLKLMRSGECPTLTIREHIQVGPQWIRLPNRLFLQYPGLDYAENLEITSERPDQLMYRTTSGYTKIYGGLLTENLVQALARCFIGQCMLMIDTKYRIVTMTHDEIVAVAPEKDAERALQFMLDVMETPPDWAPTLPVKAEGGYDVCYSK